MKKKKTIYNSKSARREYYLMTIGQEEEMEEGPHLERITEILAQEALEEEEDERERLAEEEKKRNREE